MFDFKKYRIKLNAKEAFSKENNVTFESISSKKKYIFEDSFGHKWMAHYSKEITCPYCWNRELLEGFNDVFSQYPDLMSEWDFELNSLDPKKTRVTSQECVFWICASCQKSWSTSIHNRTFHQSGCKTCSQSIVKEEFRGFLKESFSDLNKELIDFSRVNKSSGEKYFFVCNEGHNDHYSSIKSFLRVKGLCKRNKKYKDKESILEELEKNSLFENLTNDDYSFIKNSHYEDLIKKSFNWICTNNHSQTKTILRKIDRPGCGICLNREISERHNSVAYSELMKFWDKDRNTLDPKKVNIGSSQRAFFICHDSHSFNSPVYKMKKFECPVCKGTYLIKGVNDIESVFDSNSLESYFLEKNSISFKDLIKKSFIHSERYFWTCINDHETFKSFKEREENPYCSLCHESKGQAEVANFIESLGYSIIRNDRSVISPKEIDIYIPELKIGFEYNGDYWHSDRVIKSKSNMNSQEYHSLKVDLAKEKGVQIFFIWETKWETDKESVQEIIKEILFTKDF